MCSKGKATRKDWYKCLNQIIKKQNLQSGFDANRNLETLISELMLCGEFVLPI
jgi:hypothetical protein